MSILENRNGCCSRLHQESDREPYCEMESDAVIDAPQVVHPRDELERSFSRTLASANASVFMATVFKPEGRYIGRCGLYPRPQRRESKSCRRSVHCLLPGASVWDAGWRRRPVGLSPITVSGNLASRGIEAGMNVKNLASIRVIEKLGFAWVR
jgi:RimJ/RimL family protein N-acetyltransferase